MYESFLIGLGGAVLGCLVTGRSFKGALEEKLSLTYDVGQKAYGAAMAAELEIKHFDARLKPWLETKEETLFRIEKAIEDISAGDRLEEELQTSENRNKELTEQVNALSQELNQVKQSYVAMANKANEEIAKLQGTVTTYHNALMDVTRKNQGLPGNPPN